MTRAFAALLHGDVRRAIAANALSLLVLPGLLGYWALGARRLCFRQTILPMPLPPVATAGLAVLMVAFTVWRNL